jgi:alpha-L-rhamnosidase
MKQTRRAFVRNTALTAGAFTVGGIRGNAIVRSGLASPLGNPAAESTDSGHIRQQFQSPPKKFRPIARWWWPGNDVVDEELRREIDVLDKAGFGGAEVQSFIKGFDVKSFPEATQHRMESYATPVFFQHVRTAIEEARARGMFIDYTFGSGWPFGGGMAITPELAAIELRSTHLSVEGPARFHNRLQIPSVGADRLNGLPEGWAERMKKRSKVVAVVAVRGEDAQWDFHASGGSGQPVVRSGQLESGTSIDLTAQLEPDGTLQWDLPAGTWQLFVFCSVPTAQKVNAGAGQGPQLVMDHLSAEAFRAHAKRVGDAAIPYIGEYFGNGMRAIFCDSLEVAENLFWSDDFLAEFRRRRGYDLVPYLPVLNLQKTAEPFGEFVDLPIFEMAEMGEQVRHDYRQTVSDLMVERMYGQFNKWAHDHKLLSRTQAHGSPTDVLRVYGEADIPETEDLYDNGGYDFLKMAASSAHVYGRRIVGSESFVWPTAAYQTTLEKMKLAADELLTAGVNAIVYHGFPYILPDNPPPGWHPFTGYLGGGNYSSQFNELNPLWPYISKMNDYITRMQFISQLGTSVAAIALYRNDLLHGAEDVPPPPKLNQALMDAGYNYDHINADSLKRCEVRNRLLMTAGGASYRALVLPTLDAIDAALAEKLRSFASAGLPVLFAGQVPTRSEGLYANAGNTQHIQNVMHDLRSVSNVHFAVDVAEAVSMLRPAVKPDVRFRSQPLPFIQLQIGKMEAYFLRNSSDAANHLHAEFEANGAPELWDPWTGSTVPGEMRACQSAEMTSYRRSGDWVEVEIDLEPFASVLIVFDSERTGPSSWMPSHPVKRLKRTEPVGGAGWELTANGLGANGKAVTIHRDLPALIDWSFDSELRSFSGQGNYSTTFTAPAADAGSRFILDLGSVRDVAEVKINGKVVGSLLLRPYQADITGFLQSGENQLNISVTNTLFNNMALREPRTFRPGGTGNLSGLMSAGLIGPVQVQIMD